MKMTTIKIRMPESIKHFIDERVEASGYTSASEYVRELVRRDEAEYRRRVPAAPQDAPIRPLRRVNDLAREFNSASDYDKIVDYT